MKSSSVWRKRRSFDYPWSGTWSGETEWTGWVSDWTGADELFWILVDWKGVKKRSWGSEKENIPVIVVDTEVYDTDLVDVTIVTDNYQAGVLCAKDMMERQKRSQHSIAYAW